MRPVSDKMKKAWLREDKTGAYKPTVRATIQRAHLERFPYSTAKAMGGDWDHQRYRKGNYTSIIFGREAPVHELRGIISCEWSRSLDEDVATCTIVMHNTEVQPIGRADATPQYYDDPGHFTYNRGVLYEPEGWHRDWDAQDDNPWHLGVTKPWANLIVPDRIVKTYEGYGNDYSVFPHQDSNLEISGTWLIDKVTYNADATMTIEMRDVGRMLLTHTVFPPAVPVAEYPMVWSRIRSENVPGRDVKGGKWYDLKKLCTATSSNMAYVGKGLTDPPYPYYVSSTGRVNGHHPRHALDSESTDREKYWMSTGQTSRNSFVWWEMDFNSPKDVAALRIDPTAGPYRIYISVKTDKGWLGRKNIPYKVTTEDIDNGSKIPFVKSVWADRWNVFDVNFARVYRNVRKIRLTFTVLNDNRVGDYPWRAMLKDVKAYIGEDAYFGRGEKLKAVGNYRDYTHIVKWICAWGGFWWPQPYTKRNFWYTTADDKEFIPYDHSDDSTFVSGRVYGSFQRTNTYSEADLTVDLFDKKPFMDVINYIRDIVGFNFFIDEWGRPVWRMPNLWKPGNYVNKRPTDLLTTVRRTRTQSYVTIDQKTLLSYNTTLDSENVRDRIFVANSTGKTGVVIVGFNPTYEGFRRIAGWTDQHFKTKRECIVMADMIAAQQMFNYRRTSFSIPANPQIQIDDQIKLLERTTNETYFHYVLGISSTLDMETGQWTYQLSTHWLGEERSDAWVVDVEQMDSSTRVFLNVLEGSQDMGD